MERESGLTITHSADLSVISLQTASINTLKYRQRGWESLSRAELRKPAVESTDGVSQNCVHGNFGAGLPRRYSFTRELGVHPGFTRNPCSALIWIRRPLPPRPLPSILAGKPPRETPACVGNTRRDQNNTSILFRSSLIRPRPRMRLIAGDRASALMPARANPQTLGSAPCACVLVCLGCMNHL